MAADFLNVQRPVDAVIDVVRADYRPRATIGDVDVDGRVTHVVEVDLAPQCDDLETRDNVSLYNSSVQGQQCFRLDMRGKSEAAAMRAMILAAPGARLRLEDRPEPGPGQLLIRVHACGVCRTDLPVALRAVARGGRWCVPGST